nr:YoaK family protein [Kitasatospora paracochleata]
MLERGGERLFPDRPAGGFGALAPLLLGLTFVTGLVDAVSFLGLGRVFVANMTGNVVFLGFALAGDRSLSAPASLLALGAFLAGGVVGGRVAPRTAPATVFPVLIAGHAVLVAAALVAGLAGASVYPRIALLALGMGLQNAVVHRLGVPDLTTTVLTRTLTGLAVDRPGAASVRRVLSVLAMFAGALVGGLLQLHGRSDLALGGAVLLLLLAAGAALPSPPPPPPRPAPDSPLPEGH